MQESATGMRRLAAVALETLELLKQLHHEMRCSWRPQLAQVLSRSDTKICSCSGAVLLTTVHICVGCAALTTQKTAIMSFIFGREVDLPPYQAGCRSCQACQVR